MLSLDVFQDSFIEEVARKHLGLETLESRKSDSLDFKELSVWQIKAALKEVFEEAFQAGRDSKERELDEN